MSGQHEHRDADIRSLAGFGIGLALLVAVAMIAMWLLFRYLAHRPVADERLSPLVQTEELPPQPRLQVTPANELEARRASEDAVLTSYRWIDKDAGLVGIPIERAMDLIAKRGLR